MVKLDRSLVSRQMHEQPGASQLTRQQRRTLALLLRGLTNKEIAARLGIGEGTVKWHASRLYERFGIHNRTALVHELLARQRRNSRPTSD